MGPEGAHGRAVEEKWVHSSYAAPMLEGEEKKGGPFRREPAPADCSPHLSGKAQASPTLRLDHAQL